MEQFHDDDACAAYLAERRWPDGFHCPACGSTKAWRLESKAWTWECGDCSRQTSVTAGTIMHRSKLPLRTWFLAAHLVATHSNGISALQLQAKLGIGSYKTAWLLLHKLRKAMVDPDRTPLEGLVEIDEASMPYHTKDEDVRVYIGSRSEAGKLAVVGAVEVRDDGRRAGRVRLQVITDFTRKTLHPFTIANTASGSHIATDGNTAYRKLPERGHTEHVVKRIDAHFLLPWIHRVFSNLKRYALGVYHGFRKRYLQAYLAEFVFRWNRRRHYRTAFDTLLGIGIRIGPFDLKALRNEANG
jgi:hypothetical protein